jgi:hypothetical protein
MAGRNESFAIFPPLAVVVVVVDDTDTSERLWAQVIKRNCTP